MNKRFFYKMHARILGIKYKFLTMHYRLKYWFVFSKFGKKITLKERFRINPMLGYNNQLFTISLGDHVNIEPGVTFQGSGLIKIGDWVSIGANTMIGASTEVEIGFATIIASNVSIRDTNHKYDDLTKTISSQGITTKKVKICEDVWIGANVSITCGVTIGKGAIIAANAVVTHDVPPGCIYGGVPAKLIKKRGTDKELEKYIKEKQY